MRKITARLLRTFAAYGNATVVPEPDSTGDMSTSYVQPEDAPRFPVRHPLFPAQNSPESFYPTNVPPMPTAPVKIIDNQPVEAIAMENAGLPTYAPLGDPGTPGRRY